LFNAIDPISNLPPGWSIECQFTDQNKTDYVNGESVEGTIEFFNSNDPDLKLKQINIILIGEIVYNVSESSGKTRSTRTYRTRFFQQDLLPHAIGNESGVFLPIGKHTWSFSGLLDHFLLPSTDKTDTNRVLVHYFVRIEMVQIKWHKENIYKNFFINVRHNSSPFVNVTRIEKQERSAYVDIRVTLPKNHVVTGNKLIFDIDLNNSNQKLIHGIWVSLVQFWNIRTLRNPNDLTFYGNQEKAQILHQILEGTQSIRDKHLNRRFELFVPRTVLPTCIVEHPSSPTRANIFLSYELLIKVSASGLFSDVEIKIPVIVSNIIYLTTDKIPSTSKNQSRSFN
jgi:hypothetical protein